MKDVTIVVGTIGQSIMRSEDNGQTWARIGPRRGFAYEASVRCIAMHPKQHNILFAGTERGLYRSEDRGANWKYLDSALDPYYVWAIGIDPVNPDNVFVGTGTPTPAMVEMGFEKFVHDEIVDSDTFFTRDYRERHRDKVEAFFKLAWATHAKLPEFIHLCIARHNFEGTHRLGDVKAPTLVLVGEADTVGSNHIAQSKVLLERIPGAEMKTLKGQSHGFFWQAPEETNAVILDWVKKHSAN